MENAENLSNLLSHLPMVVYRFSKRDGRWQLATLTDEIENLSGYPSADFLGPIERSLRSVTHPDDVEHVHRAVAASLIGHNVYEVEYRITHSNGDEHWVCEKGRPIFDDHNVAVFLDGVIYNITARKHTEKRLQLQLNLEQLVSAIPERFSAGADADKAIDSSLQALGKLTGSDRASLWQFNSDGASCSLTHEWCGPGVESHIEISKNVSRSEVEAQNVYGRMSTGELVHIGNIRRLGPGESAVEAFLEDIGITAFTAIPILEEGQVVSWYTLNNPRQLAELDGADVSMLKVFGESLHGALKRRQAEAAVLAAKETAERASAIAKTSLENMGQGIVMVDGDGNILVYNDQLLDYVGITKEAAAACKSMDEFFQLGKQQFTEDGLDLAIRFAQSGGAATWERTTVDGRSFEVRQNPLAEGGFVRTYTDVTERKTMEEAQRQHEAKYRLLIEGLKDEYVFFTFGQDGVINYVSPSVENVLGYAQSHFTDQFYEFLTDSPINAPSLERARQALAGELHPAAVRELRHKDGSLRLLEILSVPLFGKDGTVEWVEGIARDVTEKVKADEALRSAHARMKRDLEAAASIQRSLLPTLLPENTGIVFSWQYQPCEELGGDLLNIFRITDRYVGLYVLDVSGHGVSSALLSIAVARSLSPSAREGSLVIDVDPHSSEPRVVNPAEVARRLNGSHSMEAFGGHMFTLLYGVFDLEGRTLSFVSAGHPDPIRSTPKGTAAFVGSVGGPPIGVAIDAQYEELTIDLSNSDRMYFISDGIYEQPNEDGAELGLDQLQDLIAGYHDEDITVATEALVNDVLNWSTAGDLRDDVSVLAFQFDD